MKKKNKKKKGFSLKLNFLKSKKFLLLGSLFLAAAILAAYFSFAGGPTLGKVFSWKEAKVKDYGNKKVTPSGYQFVSYRGSDWGNEYFGAYTEKSNPPYATRELSKGVIGEDVAVLNSALRFIGTFSVRPGGETKGQAVTIGSGNKAAFEALKNNQEFDDNTIAALTAISYPALDSSYGDYLGDGKLDSYEQARILTIAVSYWGVSGSAGNSGQKLAFTFGGNCKVVCVGLTNFVPSKYDARETSFYGQANLLKQGETRKAYYPRVSYATTKGTSDVKLRQGLMYAAIARGHIGVMKNDFRTDGTWDQKSEAAVRGFEKFYGLTEDGKWDERVEYHIVQELTWALYE